MKIKFQIEYIYEKGYVLGRLLNPKEDLELEVNSKLSQSHIKSILPADALNRGENQRTDLFVFLLNTDSVLKELSLGKIVEII